MKRSTARYSGLLKSPAAEIMRGIDDIHDMAHAARRLCNDIIRQTSMKPYYGKRGATAVYATEDQSDEQRQNMAQAVEHMQAATELLCDIAIAGGMTQAQIRENLRGDHWATKVQIIEDSSEV